MEEKYYHALALACGGEYKKLVALKKSHTSWESAWHAHTHTADSVASSEELWRALAQQGIQLVLTTDALFPPLLKEIPWAPHGIYYKGTLPAPDAMCVALVGTRNATPEGKSLARSIAKDLTAHHVTIMSGLALGIDVEAHVGALEGKGTTCAVLAGGLDEVTPHANAKVAEHMLALGGALISEYPPGTPPLPHRFIERNRIVSGMARAILIIEAPEKSGSLATARFALDQNRDVLVVPGPAKHPNYAGSHALIRSGATLATSAAHVLEALGIEAQTHMLPRDLTDEEMTIYQAIATHAKPLPIDKLIELTNLKPNDANKITSLLLMKGVIGEKGGGFIIQ